MEIQDRERKKRGFTRREFLGGSLAVGLAVSSGGWFYRRYIDDLWQVETFIAKVGEYSADIKSTIVAGMFELGITPKEIKGKSILFKPNLVEAATGEVHVTTHPAVVRGAIEAFLSLGASRVVVAEGSGHCRDSFRLLEESGLADVLLEDRIRFLDLNFDEVYLTENLGRQSRLETLAFPSAVRQCDWIVSMPKLKTHHWTGVTLSMKNLFGVMPGAIYGWPKNVLHHAGIENCILDIYATLQPHFAIVDGIVGMEGDGPIMGSSKPAGVLVMGRNFAAVDATCTRIMGYDPKKVPYLASASNWLGPVGEKNIRQRGETIKSVQTHFALIEKIPAHKRLLM
jgi:uncharacterized protein (DUF362 family)